MMEVVSYGVTPQIHAFDNSSIIETLSIQGDTVRSARQFVGDRPLVIGPITLRPQLVTQEPLPGELPSNVDARQLTPFAAGWTLGSVKYLAEAGVHSVTYYETVGWKGIMESAGGTPRSYSFPSQPSGVFPIYHVLRELADFAGGRAQRVDSTDPLSVVGLALSKPGRTRLLVANLTDRPQPVSIRGLDGITDARELDIQNTLFPIEGPADLGERPARYLGLQATLVLSPHGIVRIDRTAGDKEK